MVFQGFLMIFLGFMTLILNLNVTQESQENYPKSICSNFQADTQDPSITCGGAVGHLETGEIRMWRGDPVHDDHFVLHSFQLGLETK